MLIPGQSAPDLTLPCQDGSIVTLSAVRPAPAVLFFYSENGSETCTLEAIGFSAAAPAFAAAGVRLFGLSRDSVASHAKFAGKHALNLRLLSDQQGVACQAFGVWQQKNLFGRLYMGVIRSTFLIDGAGLIAKTWSNVRLKGHVDAVLAAAQAL